jgi:cell wall-associated NlpC family hydrolase
MGRRTTEAWVREVGSSPRQPEGSSNGNRRTKAGRRAALAVLAVGFAWVTVAGGAAPAFAAKKPVIPSQSEVDQANAAAHSKAAQIGETEAQLAAANAELATLNNNAEILVEKYNGAMAKLADAQKAARAAQVQLTLATQQRADAQIAMNQFAADSYRGSAGMSQLNTLLTSGSPETLLDREAALAAVSRHEQAIIDAMKQAEKAQRDAQQAADEAVADQQKASERAAKAKDAAVAAMNTQAQQVAQIKDTQAGLQAQLAVLKGKAKNLAAARAQGLAELAAQQEAERKAAAAAAAAAKKRQEELARQSGGGSSSGGGSGTTGTPVDLVTPGTGHSVSSAAQRATAVAFAQSQIGIWYRWAGAGEVGPTVTSSGTQNVVGYDCSGLTMRAYQAAGISLGHYTGLQWDEGMHVSRDQLQPGDLVFFATNTSDPSTIHHVGIYIGNGRMIDAPQTGEQIGNHNAFRPDYIGAVRP